MVTGISTDTLTILVGTGAVAALLAWLIRGLIAKRQTADLVDEWESRVDHLARKRNGLLVEADKYRTTIEAQQSEIHKHAQATQR